jgi:hypothetical protein
VRLRPRGALPRRESEQVGKITHAYDLLGCIGSLKLEIRNSGEMNALKSKHRGLSDNTIINSTKA